MKNRILSVVVFALGALPTAALACDQCMGVSDSSVRPAVNGAIFFMLGMVGMMATGVGFFMRYLVRRAHAPQAPHIQLVEMMTLPESPNHV